MIKCTEKFALLIKMGWDTNTFCIHYGMQDEIGKKKKGQHINNKELGKPSQRRYGAETF